MHAFLLRWLAMGYSSSPSASFTQRPGARTMHSGSRNLGICSGSFRHLRSTDGLLALCFLDLLCPGHLKRLRDACSIFPICRVPIELGLPPGPDCFHSRCRLAHPEYALFQASRVSRRFSHDERRLATLRFTSKSPAQNSKTRALPKSKGR